MFFLHAQIHYGLSFSSALIESFFTKSEDASKNQFKAMKSFFGVVGVKHDWLFGVQAFLGATTDFKFYGGAQGIFGYEFEETIQVYGGLGIEKQRGDTHSLGWGNCIVGAHMDAYLSVGFGLGVSFEWRPFFSEAQSAQTKEFESWRVLVKIIFRNT